MLILLSFDLHTNKRTSCYVGECLLSFRYILMKSINNLITFSFQCIDLNTRLCKRISISYDINIFKETKAFSQIFLNAHVKIQDYNFNASSCRFVFELFICYLFGLWLFFSSWKIQILNRTNSMETSGWLGVY